MKYEGKLEGREWEPRDPRVDADFEVSVHFDAGEVAARVLNLSSDGFRLRAQVPLAVGSAVKLAAHGAEPVEAHICWAVGCDAGGVFTDPPAL